MSIEAALIGAGGAILGGLFGGSGAKKAAKAQLQAQRETQRLFEQKSLEALLRQAFALYGPAAETYLRAVLPAEDVKKLFGTEDQILPGGRIKKGKPGVINLSALREYAIKSPGFMERMAQIAREEQAAGRDLLSAFDTERARIAAMGENILGETAKFGEERRKQIKLAAERALRSLNRAAESRLGAAGLGGSTILTQAMLGNTRNITEWEQGALGDLADRHMELRSGIRGANLNRDLSLASQRLGILANLMDRNLNLRTMPLNTELQMVTGPAWNWWSQSNAPLTAVGVSPSGAQMSSLGNVLATAGGYILGNLDWENLFKKNKSTTPTIQPNYGLGIGPHP